MTTDQAERLLTRAGQMSDLTLERWLSGELTDQDIQALEAYLVAHPEDQRRLDAARAHQATVPTQAPHRGQVLQFPTRTLALLGTTLAAAAGLALWLQQDPQVALGPPAGDGIRIKAGPMDFEVFVHDGTAARRVTDGDTVAPGDKVGFRIKARAEGYLLVAGIDERGPAYPCWPIGEAPKAVHWTSQDAVQLDRAMQLDATPGAERFVAAFCEQPMDFATLSQGLTQARADQWKSPPTVRKDCTMRVVQLDKQPPQKPPPHKGDP